MLKRFLMTIIVLFSFNMGTVVYAQSQPVPQLQDCLPYGFHVWFVFDYSDMCCTGVQWCDGISDCHDYTRCRFLVSYLNLGEPVYAHHGYPTGNECSSGGVPR